jgi:hypothetical protein
MQNPAFLSCCAVLAATAAFAQQAEEGQSLEAAGVVEGQEEALAAMGDPEAAISTQLTFQSHSVGANSSAFFLEGAACPGATTMVSGACHPGFNDRVIIINQFPNVGANTWRCGFRNNNNVSRTVWIYTLCAQ